MTTTVKIEAHCSNEKEVVISISDGVDVILQDGENYETYVYDLRSITVKEQLK